MKELCVFLPKFIIYTLFAILKFNSLLIQINFYKKINDKKLITIDPLNLQFDFKSGLKYFSILCFLF